MWGDSDITTNVNSGAGGGGNIDLKADSILAFDDSDILAFAENGTGGDINLDTPAFFGENYRSAPRGTDPDTLEDRSPDKLAWTWERTRGRWQPLRFLPRDFA